MPVREILRLGHPLLWMPAAPVDDPLAPEVLATIQDLAETLADFRTRRGFGRGIAAPQIGVRSRIVHLQVDGPLSLLNPEIVSASAETFELWDDCFSFPDWMVRVQRHRAVTVQYRDLAGEERTIHARDSLSELLQHEIDHLDGILATDRARHPRAIAWRGEVESGRAG